MGPERSDTESWELLRTTLELGEELDYILVECSTEDVRGAFAERLERYAIETQRSFRKPPDGDSLLTWLDQERAASARDSGVRDSRPIYFASVPAGDDEGVILARLNENRDNLHRDMRGALCLTGLGGFLDRFPSRAPSIWSFRTKTFTFEGLSSNGTQVKEARERYEKGGEKAPSSVDKPYDAYISAAYRDEAFARDLVRRLETDGVRCLFIEESAQDRRIGLSGIVAQAGEAKFIIPLLSPDYGESGAWRALEESREMREFSDRIRGRMLPVLVRHCLPPPFFAGFNPLDFRSTESAERDYPNLLAAVMGRTATLARAKNPHDLAFNVSFLAIGAQRATGVVRLEVEYSGERRAVSTGFLIAPDLVLTCHHCLYDNDLRRAVGVDIWKDYQLDLAGKPMVTDIRSGLADTILGDHASNWAAVRLAQPFPVAHPLSLRIPSRAVRVGDRVSVIHHPRGIFKQVSLVGEVYRVDSLAIQYTHLTEAGSTGAPLFNERWEVVGMHSHRVKAPNVIDGSGTFSEAVRVEEIMKGLIARGLLLTSHENS